MSPDPIAECAPLDPAPLPCRLLTLTCFDRLPLLTFEMWKPWLSESLDRALERTGCDLLAFVYMPEHIHLLLRPTSLALEAESLALSIERPFAQRVRRTLEETASAPLLERLTARRGSGRPTFRFWQPGPAVEVEIRERGAILRAMARLHTNPIRRGLCLSPAEWRWSSWGLLHGGDLFRDSALPRVTRWRSDPRSFPSCHAGQGKGEEDFA